MFNVSIPKHFSFLNVFIVCIRNTAVFKLILLVCTHVYSYMFSTLHPQDLHSRMGALDFVVRESDLLRERKVWHVLIQEHQLWFAAVQ